MNCCSNLSGVILYFFRYSIRFFALIRMLILGPITAMLANAFISEFFILIPKKFLGKDMMPVENPPTPEGPRILSDSHCCPISRRPRRKDRPRCGAKTRAGRTWYGEG